MNNLDCSLLDIKLIYMKTILTIIILAITINAFSQVKEREGKFYNKKELWGCIQPDLSGQKCVSYTQAYITEDGVVYFSNYWRCCSKG